MKGSRAELPVVAAADLEQHDSWRNLADGQCRVDALKLRFNLAMVHCSAPALDDLIPGAPNARMTAGQRNGANLVGCDCLRSADAYTPCEVRREEPWTI